jgi:nucleoside-diphosphate-sugar epimerase
MGREAPRERLVRALVTGGGGFLGRAIVEQLLRSGHTVTAAGRHDYPEVAALGARTVRMDLLDPDAVSAAVRGHDVVFHAAAKAGFWGAREAYERTNVRGTENVLRACREHAVERLVYTSSPSVVFDGRDHDGSGMEQLQLRYPAVHEAFYPATKAAAERAVLAANGARLATVALRPHLIYGPRDPHLLPRLFARARARRLVIVGDGTNRVSVTYVDNAAAAHLQAAQRLAPGSACAGRAYFVSDPQPVALWPWLNELLRRVDLPPATRRVPLWAARAAGAFAESVWSALRLPGEPPMTRFVASQLARSHCYDTGPASEQAGYAALVGPEEALERTVAFWKRTLAQRSGP